MRRYWILAAAVVVEVLLGFQYSWGVFDKVLQARHGFTASEAQDVLAAQIVTFALAFPVAGWVLHRFGPRRTVFLGGILYGASLLSGGVFGRNPSAMFWGTGVLYGVGLALAYICPLVTIQKWFPRYKGIATGFIVGAYASSSFLMAAVEKALMARGFSAFQVLGGIGATAIVVILPLSLAFVDPPTAKEETPRSRFPKGVLRTTHFWALVAGFFVGTTAGLCVVGSLESIGGTLGTPVAWLGVAVMAFSVGNMVGRLSWGVITEILGTRLAVTAQLLMEAACVTGMVFFGGSGPAFIALTFGIAFGYGGNFVLYVTDVARTYGSDRVGSVYGLVALIYVLSGFFGAPSAGYSYDHWHTYSRAMLGVAALALVGLAAFLALYRQPAAEATAPVVAEPAGA